MIELLFALVCSNVTAKGIPLGTSLNSLFLTTFSNMTVYIYGITHGLPCLHLKAYLENLALRYGFKLVWVPVDKGVPKNATAVKVAESFGVPYVPVVGVYCGKHLVAVVVGDVENDTFWSDVVFRCTNATRVYYMNKFLGYYERKEAQKGTAPYAVLSLAAIDALNPIGLTIFILFLLACINTKERCWKEALEFVVSYAIAHMVFGLFLSAVPASPYYPVAGMAISAVIIAAALKPTPKLKKLLSAASGKLSKMALRRESPFVLGALAGTVGMSPCVLGTFLTAASAIGVSGHLEIWLYYAAIYASVPLLIAYLVHRGRKLNPTKMIVGLATFSFFVSLLMTLYNFGYLKIPSL